MAMAATTALNRMMNTKAVADECSAWVNCARMVAVGRGPVVAATAKERLIRAKHINKSQSEYGSRTRAWRGTSLFNTRQLISNNYDYYCLGTNSVGRVYIYVYTYANDLVEEML